MTGEKNRGTSLEKLWKLDDETLTTPEHDRLVMLFFDEDFKRKFVSYVERGSTGVEITGVSVKDLEYRAVGKNRDGKFVPLFAPNKSGNDNQSYNHTNKHCPYVKSLIDIICPSVDNPRLSSSLVYPSLEYKIAEDLCRKTDAKRETLWKTYFECHYTNWKLKHENELIQNRINNIPVIKEQLVNSIKTTDPLDWYTTNIQSEVPITTGRNTFIVGY